MEMARTTPELLVEVRRKRGREHILKYDHAPPPTYRIKGVYVSLETNKAPNHLSRQEKDDEVTVGL